MPLQIAVCIILPSGIDLIIIMECLGTELKFPGLVEFLLVDQLFRGIPQPKLAVASFSVLCLICRCAASSPYHLLCMISREVLLLSPTFRLWRLLGPFLVGRISKQISNYPYLELRADIGDEIRQATLAENVSKLLSCCPRSANQRGPLSYREGSSLPLFCLN